jgi:hypothetical protein
MPLRHSRFLKYRQLQVQVFHGLLASLVGESTHHLEMRRRRHGIGPSTLP